MTLLGNLASGNLRFSKNLNIVAEKSVFVRQAAWWMPDRKLESEEASTVIIGHCSGTREQLSPRAMFYILCRPSVEYTLFFPFVPAPLDLWSTIAKTREPPVGLYQNGVRAGLGTVLLWLCLCSRWQQEYSNVLCAFLGKSQAGMRPPEGVMQQPQSSWGMYYYKTGFI